MSRQLLTGRLVDIADQRRLPEALAHHLRLLESSADLVHSLMVTDQHLQALDRLLHEPLRVSVRNTTGAGGLVALSQRQFTRLEIVAVDSPVRDPGDPVSAVARIAAAARELDPAVTVTTAVDPGPRLSEAIALAEAEALQLAIDVEVAHAAELIHTCVEADVGFVVDVPDGDPARVAGSCAAVLAAIDDADLAEINRALHIGDSEAQPDWPEEADHQRLLRRVVAFRSPDLNPLVSLLR